MKFKRRLNALYKKKIYKIIKCRLDLIIIHLSGRSPKGPQVSRTTANCTRDVTTLKGRKIIN